MKTNNSILFILLFILLKGNAQDLNSTLYLMPWPKEIKETSSKFNIDRNISISISGNNQDRVHNASINFLRRLSNRTGIFLNQGFPLVDNAAANIKIIFDKNADLSIEDDESYTLNVYQNNILLNAITDIGAIRGLETLLQLTNFNENGYYFEGVSIKDSPRFVWRGLMIDVARHFQPIEVLKRNLDAMASVKMNVFHWHLTDDQGFRVESKIYPKLHKIGGDGLYYTQEQIKDIVNYASNLGIRVIPEFDVPGHATAILAAYPEFGSVDGAKYSVERNSGVFDPTLNPIKDETYTFLENLFSEMAPLFPDEYFHIGGDENEGKHWNENEDIQVFKKEHGLKTNHDLQTYFNIKLERILNKLGKKLMGWDEIMTPNMPTTAVIHSWRGEKEGFPKGGTLIDATKNGYSTVLSAGFYIDRMLSVEHHYTSEPIGDVKLTKEERARILGGEATMWSELVTPFTIDSRIWPRTAAIAERLWSKKEVNNIENMKYRLKEVSFRLEELGMTHIKNSDVILRGMTNNQDISSLKILRNICEPLKIYSRNKGGTEYQTYSPFTLFADACINDAEDAVMFNTEVIKYLNAPNKKSLDILLSHLNIWNKNHNAFSQIKDNPNVKILEELSKNLSEVSQILIPTFSNKKISRDTFTSLQENIKILSKPFSDTELAILNSLNKLVEYSKTNYLVN
ncbi:beta-N-acetylhexosaminidase [Wocania ichthyoenteri]|uniref:beta-N-acetylhexosaminidase n=1 Tax=Wocania ichthyoenteri TaxID=1230531 RepID=UPI00053D27DA|nr:family 20 glycosylhydrolase [Wocania ichthyoenteri]